MLPPQKATRGPSTHTRLSRVLYEAEMLTFSCFIAAVTRAKGLPSPVSRLSLAAGELWWPSRLKPATCSSFKDREQRWQNFKLCLHWIVVSSRAGHHLLCTVVYRTGSELVARDLFRAKPNKNYSLWKMAASESQGYNSTEWYWLGVDGTFGHLC